MLSGAAGWVRVCHTQTLHKSTKVKGNGSVQPFRKIILKTATTKMVVTLENICRKTKFAPQNFSRVLPTFPDFPQ
jgi:hypothetical protein